MKTTLCIQIIHTSWTKKSRGGPLATPRNAVPLAVPIEDWQSGYLSVQYITYGERDAFQTPTINREKFDLHSELHFKWGGFVLNWDGQQAMTEFHPADYHVGSPGIKSSDPNIGSFIVETNQWVRLCWQGRFSDYDDGRWWYEHTCINIVRFDGNENSNVFLHSEPTRQFIHLPHLH